MSTFYMQIIINVILGHFINFVTSVCVNPQYTSLIDAEMENLEWVDLTEHEILNATEKAFLSDQSCARVSVEQHTPYNHRTLCPWEYVRDYDENRFPPLLFVAKCACRTCSQHRHYQCRPVLYSVPVLVKHCKHGVVRWMRKTHLVSVACTCVRPEIRIVRKRLSRILNIDFDYFDVY